MDSGGFPMKRMVPNPHILTCSFSFICSFTCLSIHPFIYLFREQAASLYQFLRLTCLLLVY